MGRLAIICGTLRPLFERDDVSMVVAFGSVAAGTEGRDSDIDLGVMCDLDCGQIAPLVMRLLGTERFDLVDLRRASPLLAMSIAKTGKVLYEASPALFASFASLALRRYEDSKRLRQARKSRIAAFLQERDR